MSHRTKTPVVAPRVQQQPSVGVEVEGDDTDHHPAVVAFLSVAAGGLHNKKKSTSKASTNPATAGASSSTSSPRYPYTSVSFSPCRRYAVIAGKELLQIVRVGPKGLRLVQTIPTAAYFQQKQHQQPSDPRGRTIPPQDSGFLNLRDFARGVGQQQQQQQQSPQSASSSTGGGVNAIMNIVVTDVAWSSGIVPSKSNEDLLLASSSDDEQQGHDGFGSIGNLPGDRQHHQLQTSLIAAAGSNGVIVVWSAALLLGLPTHADGDTPGNSKNNEAVQKSPTAPVVQQPEAELSKHTRQVNRLAWHPTKHGLLLSASQDGSVLLWERIRRRNDDLVDKKSVSADSLKNKPNRFQGLFGGLTQQHQQQQQQLSDAGTLVQPLHLKHQRFQQQQQQYQWQCRATFTPKSEAVRDLRWSPFYDDGTSLYSTLE